MADTFHAIDTKAYKEGVFTHGHKVIDEKNVILEEQWRDDKGKPVDKPTPIVDKHPELPPIRFRTVIRSTKKAAEFWQSKHDKHFNMRKGYHNFAVEPTAKGQWMTIIASEVGAPDDSLEHDTLDDAERETRKERPVNEITQRDSGGEHDINPRDGPGS